MVASEFRGGLCGGEAVSSPLLEPLYQRLPGMLWCSLHGTLLGQTSHCPIPQSSYNVSYIGTFL